jgi:hypothetical protein
LYNLSLEATRQIIMLPNLNVNEILHHIGNKLPSTNYKPARIKALILSIDGISLSDIALETRLDKIIEAHGRLQYTYHHLAFYQLS